MTGPRSDPAIPPLLSLSEAGALLGITRQAALSMVNTGRLPGQQVGMAGWVVRRDVVERIRKERAAS